MTTAKPPAKRARRQPAVDRRIPASAQGLDVKLRRLKGMLGQPLSLQKRDGKLHVVLVDRRRAAHPGQPPTPQVVYEELRTRLAVANHDQATRVMRHLVAAGDELRRGGWAGVGRLPARVLDKALVQAQMLASEGPSPAMSLLIDQLLLLKAAAELRAERLAQGPKAPVDHSLEVSEVTHQEFEEMERRWQGTVPLALTPTLTPTDGSE